MRFRVDDRGLREFLFLTADCVRLRGTSVAETERGILDVTWSRFVTVVSPLLAREFRDWLANWEIGVPVRVACVGRVVTKFRAWPLCEEAAA